ncbi:MAG: N-acetylglutamate synthase-like GNAT family acetyltransferase [Enterobacterales bacterium]|jgi:N-acetylglutamate synthase-like GNAT family acetyltransferase
MSAKHPYNIQWLSDVEIPLANKFYRKHGFRGKAKRYGSCAVVKDNDKQIIACAYLRNYNTFNLLSGVAVDSAVQRQGIARLLLEFMTQRFDQLTFTFPYENLLPFYASIGFEIVAIEQVETSVSELYGSYVKQGRTIKLMKFLAAN